MVVVFPNSVTSINRFVSKHVNMDVIGRAG